MFGRDAYIPLVQLLHHQIRYTGDSKGLLALDILRHSYANECSKVHKANVQDNKVTYPVDEMIKYLPAAKVFGHTTKYQAHSKLTEDLH